MARESLPLNCLRGGEAYGVASIPSVGRVAARSSLSHLRSVPPPNLLCQSRGREGAEYEARGHTPASARSVFSRTPTPTTGRNARRSRRSARSVSARVHAASACMEPITPGAWDPGGRRRLTRKSSTNGKVEMATQRLELNAWTQSRDEPQARRVISRTPEPRPANSSGLLDSRQSLL
jgi:hypothetical protein